MTKDDGVKLIQYVLDQVSEYGWEAVSESGVDAIWDGWDRTTIHVCQGPPRCSLQGEAAVAAQQAGCHWCRRIVISQGTETVVEPTEQ